MTNNKRINNFRMLVAALCDLAASHPEERVRWAARGALHSFVLLNSQGHPDALDGPEIVKIIENAIMTLDDQPTSEAVN